jgi:hypothetical protein
MKYTSRTTTGAGTSAAQPYHHMKTSITNMRGRTFCIGDTVTHNDNWKGVVFKIDDSRLYVMPYNAKQVPAHDRWLLARPAEDGRTDFIRSRDHGQSMGNFREAWIEPLSDGNI